MKEKHTLYLRALSLTMQAMKGSQTVKAITKTEVIKKYLELSIRQTSSAKALL